MGIFVHVLSSRINKINPFEIVLLYMIKLKKKYIAPEIEIIEFDVEDVIEASGTGEGGSEDDFSDDD